MPDRDLVDRLRGMIRDMERARGREGDAPQFPPVPRIGPSRESSAPAGSSPAGSGLAPEAPKRGVFREVKPVSLESTDGLHSRVYRTVYPEGAAPELRQVPEAAFPAFRSLEPALESMDGWLFLDIETTGLIGAATVAFLVGLGRWTEDGFSVTQFFLRDRQDEEFMLDQVKSHLEDRPVMVTFNGKAFDLPVLQARFTMCGMRPPAPSRVHLDLLSLARNMGRRPEYGQSLKEAVRRFTGTVRDGDIPGNLIPALYFIYEREGDSSVLEPVMKHNRLDILDMVCLLWVFGRVLSGQVDAGDAAALAGAGKLHLRKGNLDLARRCLETAMAGKSGCAGPEDAASLRLLGHVLRKQGDWRGALDAWERVVSSAGPRDEDYLWLARCYEVASADIVRSLEVVSRPIAAYEGSGQEPPFLLSRRRKRLKRLLKAKAARPAER